MGQGVEASSQLEMEYWGGESMTGKRQRLEEWVRSGISIKIKYIGTPQRALLTM